MFTNIYNQTMICHIYHSVARTITSTSTSPLQLLISFKYNNQLIISHVLSNCNYCQNKIKNVSVQTLQYLADAPVPKKKKNTCCYISSGSQVQPDNNSNRTTHHSVARVITSPRTDPESRIIFSNVSNPVCWMTNPDNIGSMKILITS